ncbi:response regulator, partial [Planktothrix sp. FACHB-1355]
MESTIEENTLINKLIYSHKVNILVVDDCPNNLRVLSSILTQNGYIVRKALDGEIAISACQKILPDLILLDIMMPNMDGYQLCQYFKQNEKTRHIPIIFISALDDVLDKVKAFNSGGADYISKPFEVKEVLA